MSTYAEIIKRVDRNKPNAFDAGDKLRWLLELEGKIALEVMMLTPATVRSLGDDPDPKVSEPLVSYPYEDIYDRWLEAKIDYHNGEYTDYQNAMEAYNAVYSRFVNWFLNSYDPIQGYGRKDVYE